MRRRARQRPEGQGIARTCLEWNIFDLSHVLVNVDAARMSENVWNDCKVHIT